MNGTMNHIRTTQNTQRSPSGRTRAIKPPDKQFSVQSSLSEPIMFLASPGAFENSKQFVTETHLKWVHTIRRLAQRALHHFN